METSPPGVRIGLISDTHGLLRPEARAFLHGSDFIVHAGDICDPDILSELNAIAPVTAVRGNNDYGPWARALRETECLHIGGLVLYAIHDLAQQVHDPLAAKAHVVISGHSHRPHVETRDGVLFINPGSAGPRRFRLPISIGEIFIANGSAMARTVDLASGSAMRIASIPSAG